MWEKNKPLPFGLILNGLIGCNMQTNDQLELRIKNLEKVLITLLDSLNPVVVQSATMGIDDNMHYNEDTIMASNLKERDLVELINRIHHREVTHV